MAVEFPCPYCSKPVSPTAPNAMMSAGSKQWVHKECEPQGKKGEQRVTEPGLGQRAGA